jgi:hypothetical protein
LCDGRIGTEQRRSGYHHRNECLPPIEVEARTGHNALALPIQIGVVVDPDAVEFSRTPFGHSATTQSGPDGG